MISLGKFDGLHRGHERLMERMFAERGVHGYQTLAFTFDIPPRQQLGEDAQVLTTNEEKRLIFERTGLDYLFECPFTPEVMRMEPEDFIRWIVEAFSVRVIVAGYDFCFGHNRAGNYRTLRGLAPLYGYEAVVLEKVQEDGRDVSSTFVREEIRKGNIEKANHLLGYPFFVWSPVVHGKRFGRTLGIPTANLEPPSEKLLPKNGVYVSRVHVQDMCYPGVTNVGCRPTVGADGRVGVETHLIGFDGNLYGESLTVEFFKWLRPERRFASAGELRAQMERDIAAAESCYKNITKKVDNVTFGCYT